MRIRGYCTTRMGGQTLAIIIKEMQVRDGGGEVVVFFSCLVLVCVWHLQKSLVSMVFSKLTQVCNMIKSIYFVILQQTKTNKDKYYSANLSVQ